MISIKEFQIRLLCVLILIFANPIIQKIMMTIAHIQAYTSQTILSLSQKIFNPWGIKLNLYLVMSISQIFWPIVITFSISKILKWIKKSQFDHPKLYLCFIWLLFNGSYTVML
jgi:hypothetical protein